MIQQRLKAFRNILLGKNLDAFLVSNFYNIYYLSGFKTLVDDERESWLLLTSKNVYLFTDARYIYNKSIPNNNFLIFKRVTPDKGLIKHLQEIASEENIRSLGIEADDLKLNEYQKLKESLSPQIISTEKLIVKQRAIKTNDEIQKIKRACEIADQCFSEIVKIVRVGFGEKEIYRKMEFYLKEKGYDLAFDPIIAVDENSALMHYDTRSGNNKKIKNGSVILFDFGAKYLGYLSDMTRIVFIGRPKNEILNNYNLLLSAQEKTIGQIRHKKYYKQIDKYCRQFLINRTSFASYAHSTGHGVGLEIHEYPKVSHLSEEEILPNQVITIEPGIYAEDRWGMRIEDTVLINKQGAAEVLTKFNKQVLIV